MKHMEYMRMRQEQENNKPARKIIGTLTTKVHSVADLEQSERQKLEKNISAKVDMVNHPLHYNEFGIECIDAIEAATGEGFEAYLQGNILKYLWRYKYKSKPIEDLQKAEWYLNRLIKTVKNVKVKNKN